MKTRSNVLVAGLSCLLFVSLCGVVRLTTDPGDKLFEMLFHRTFVQYVTLFVFVLCLTALAGCAFQHVKASRRLHEIELDPEAWTLGTLSFGTEPAALGRQLAENGRSGISLTVDHLMELWDKQVRHAFEFVGSLICFLPALGLFGTVLGLHRSLFAAFGNGQGGPAAVREFVASLAVALDTTVLALGAALITGALSWAMQRLERERLQRQADLVRKVLTKKFSTVYAEVRSEGDKLGPRPSSAGALRAELKVALTATLEEALSRFDERLRDVAQSNRANLERIVREMLEQQKTLEQALVSRLAEDLRSFVTGMEGLLERQNKHAVQSVARGLGRLSKTLDRRIPGELIIRYDHNGHTEPEEEDDD